MSYTQEDIQRLFEAIEMSSISNNSQSNQPEGGPFGAVIYKDGKCIAKGYNHVLANNDPTAHAEVYTIREACKALQTFDLSGCVLYSSCEPCPMCLMASKWANLDNIFFAATRDDADQTGFRDAGLYKMLNEGVYATFIPECRDAAVKVMKEWSLKYNQDKIY